MKPEINRKSIPLHLKYYPTKLIISLAYSINNWVSLSFIHLAKGLILE